MPIARFQTADGRIARFEVPDGTTPEQATQMMSQHFGQFETQQKTPKQSDGNLMGGAMTALQGAGMGFMDEVAGLGGAIAGKAANLLGVGDNKTFAEDYKTIRDRYRGDVKQFAEDNPKSALALSIAGSLPTAAGGLGIKATSMLGRAGAGAATGAAYGGISGLGGSEADTAGGVLADTAKGAAIGSALGGIASPVVEMGGKVAGNVAQRFNDSAALDAAKIKLAEALQRDNPQSAFGRTTARLRTLGKEATIADAGGANTAGLLDRLAILPGETKQAVENLIHSRQAGRAGRMIGAADEALGTGGASASQTVKDLIQTRAAESKPLYDAVRLAPVVIDDNMASILKATAPFHNEAEKLAGLSGIDLNIGALKVGDKIPLQHLDQLKQTLFDVADAAKRRGENQLASKVDNLRVNLTGALDEAAPKNAAGESLYKAARDKFAGHSQIISSVEKGQKALYDSADNIKDLVSGMSQSEMEGFRIGVLQSLRDKLGSEAGQTQIMKMWKEPKTAERLKAIFGNDYRQFAADVARESRLKGLERVGRGSQTAERIYGAGDLDANPVVGEAGKAIANAKSGNLFGLADAIGGAWNRVQMPEPVRNQLGQLLLSKGTQGKANINALQDYLDALNANRSSRAGSIAAELGYQGGK